MLANMAMDSKRSIQVSSDRLDVRWDKVHASALHDVGHWLHLTSDKNLSRFGAFPL
ncbi:hypothetical protein PI125_g15834 [Phytophthora idaei]|nr:hypothetical protein PI125_g15834 [Phytophthora idaei]